MTQTVDVPLWLLLLFLAFAAIAALDKVMIPSVRWFFRRRLERAVAKLNQRLDRPIQPFKLARRYDMIQRIIYDPQVTRAVAEHAKAEGIPENVAFQEARRYAREIVPSFSAFAYFGFAIRVARFLSNSFYRVRLGHLAADQLRDVDKDATVVFVMNHRSNMDYVLVTYLAAERSALSYAVGEWAQVWPLSRLIRAMGAYFIRRKSRNELYRKVLACYVRQATQAGVTQAMFPEGGLSLTGALMPPKLGLLKYIVDGFDPEGRDVVFVPVALNYDHVLEDRILINAQKGGERRFEARIGVVAAQIMRQIWLRLIGRYNRFGYTGVSFGAPVSLKTFVAEQEGDPTKHLARKLMKDIGSIVPVLPVPLVALILRQNGPMTQVEIEMALKEFLVELTGGHLILPRDSRGYAVEVAVRGLKRREVIREVDGKIEIAPGQEDILAFYASSIRHLLPDHMRGNAASAKELSADAGS
jgi:glycerol-3-phosphate O-acyltransferase